jgi:ATP-dependent RNA helicase DeaD
MVDDLAENLVGRGYFAVGLHGDLSQAQRDRVMAGFRSGQTDILIATDVAARGIDVNDVEAVFNYDVPQDVEYYVHRIGRTGRAGKKGRAFTLVVGREIYKVREIEKICKTKIEVRMVPSAADIKTAKSEKILDRILDVEQNNDMNDMIRIIEQKLNDEDCTAIELAAAFLKEQMGADLEDIPVEDFAEEKKKHHGKRDGDRRRNYDDRDGDHRRHHSYRDGDHKRKYDDRDGDHKRKYDDRDGDHRRKHDDRDGGKKKKKRGNDERALNALNWQPPKKKKKKD